MLENEQVYRGELRKDTLTEKKEKYQHFLSLSPFSMEE